jgi:hypothetical protein
MRKGFLIYEEMRKYLTIYEEVNCNCSILNFLIYEGNLSFLLSVYLTYTVWDLWGGYGRGTGARGRGLRREVCWGVNALQQSYG